MIIDVFGDQAPLIAVTESMLNVTDALLRHPLERSRKSHDPSAADITVATVCSFVLAAELQPLVGTGPFGTDKDLRIATQERVDDLLFGTVDERVATIGEQEQPSV